MKLFYLSLIMFVSAIASGQKQFQPAFSITTFKSVPKDMEGCGENFFLNKQDEKAARFIFLTDYGRGLIYVNNKMVLVTRSDKTNGKSSSIFSNKDYILAIKYGQRKTTGDESYEVKSAIITLKYHLKVVWTKSVIGGGGC